MVKHLKMPCGTGCTHQELETIPKAQTSDKSPTIWHPTSPLLRRRTPRIPVESPATTPEVCSQSTPAAWLRSWVPDSLSFYVVPEICQLCLFCINISGTKPNNIHARSSVCSFCATSKYILVVRPNSTLHFAPIFVHTFEECAMDTFFTFCCFFFSAKAFCD